MVISISLNSSITQTLLLKQAVLYEESWSNSVILDIISDIFTEDLSSQKLLKPIKSYKDSD